MPQPIIIYLCAVNVLTWAIFGIDKAQSKRHAWRTPEAVLMALATIGGSAGALVAMLLFHHKTRHPKFAIGVPLLLLLHTAILLFLPHIPLPF